MTGAAGGEEAAGQEQEQAAGGHQRGHQPRPGGGHHHCHAHLGWDVLLAKQSIISHCSQIEAVVLNYILYVLFVLPSVRHMDQHGQLCGFTCMPLHA